MMQNEFVAIRDAKDFWGNPVKEYRCEECAGWVPLTFSCPACRKLVCQPCFEEHLERQP